MGPICRVPLSMGRLGAAAWRCLALPRGPATPLAMRRNATSTNDSAFLDKLSRPGRGHGQARGQARQARGRTARGHAPPRPGGRLSNFSRQVITDPQLFPRRAAFGNGPTRATLSVPCPCPGRAPCPGLRERRRCCPQDDGGGVLARWLALAPLAKPGLKTEGWGKKRTAAGPGGAGWRGSRGRADTPRQ